MKVSISAGDGATVSLPLYVGVGGGFFSEHGVDVELIGLAGSGTILGAAVSGDVDGAVVTLPGVIEAISAGAPLKAIASLQEGATLSIPVTADFMEAQGWDPAAPVTIEQLGAVENINVGVTQIGGGGDSFGRLLLEAAGLHDGDGYQVTALGDAPSLVAAWGRGIVDIMVVTPTAAMSAIDEFGGGYLFDPFNQDLAGFSESLAAFDAQQGSVVAASTSSLEDDTNADMYRCFMAALDESSQLIINDPAAAGEAVQEFFPQYADRPDQYAMMIEGVATQTSSSPVMQTELVAGSLAYVGQTTGEASTLTPEDIIDNTFADTVGV